ncbi:MAG: UDP-N-acetylmuramoyl-L-alanyl-D-glutamate--2,6-diaminopimelate ligase [Betaproteobacteria bacterium]|nr:UDP-N-acetylmuramoyl-L-alanyl-D-glutamate--2,6-diaminopimelate ligase [Betaproteobacteria bacterium]
MSVSAPPFRPLGPADRAAVLEAIGGLGVPVARLVIDSRQLQAGDTFLAYPGEHADGRDFIAQAIARGANAVIWDSRGFAWDPLWTVPNVGIADLRARAGFIAAQVYGDPSARLWMIGVTGTNGKTSCAHWLAQALGQAGRRTAVLGTLGNGFPDALVAATHTTPEAVALQRELRRLEEAGAQAVAMEVSSHALAQGRVHGVAFDVAILTNLSRDHLDYHGDMASYARAKAGLFQWETLKAAVLNADDPFGRELRDRIAAGVKVLNYGFGEGEVQGRLVRMGPEGIAMEVITPWGRGLLESRLLGRFNAANLLATAAGCLASDMPFDQVLETLARITPVPGRMQCLGGGDRPLVVVDYAHTPDALEKVLEALRGVMPGDARLIALFGCGGERDRGKRPLMGAVASRLADEVVVTNDNPRHEAPGDIIADILAGLQGNHRVIADRAEAILYAIERARPADIVLLAGKGHEPYQDIAGTRWPFSDLDVAARVLDNRRNQEPT